MGANSATVMAEAQGAYAFLPSALSCIAFRRKP
jgi:hypothetical protein